MATLLKVLINLADIKSAGGVALRVGIQGGLRAPAIGDVEVRSGRFTPSEAVERAVA